MNYREMVQLYDRYREQGFEILAFPCNQFKEQEPGTEAEIKAWAQSTYNVTFPMFSKIDVNGTHTHAVYRFCRTKSSMYDASTNQAEVIPWNFAKFLVNEQGQVVHYFEPPNNPLSFEDKIQAML